VSSGISGVLVRSGEAEPRVEESVAGSAPTCVWSRLIQPVNNPKIGRPLRKPQPATVRGRWLGMLTNGEEWTPSHGMLRELEELRRRLGLEGIHQLIDSVNDISLEEAIDLDETISRHALVANKRPTHRPSRAQNDAPSG
jgi:hypothetical protein